MPSSRDSLGDAQKFFETALDSKKGIVLKFSSRGALVNFRQRLYMLRAHDRKLSMKAYEPGESEYNTSQYDPIVLEMVVPEKPEDPWRLRLVKADNRVPTDLIDVEDIE